MVFSLSLNIGGEDESFVGCCLSLFSVCYFALLLGLGDVHTHTYMYISRISIPDLIDRDTNKGKHA